VQVYWGGYIQMLKLILKGSFLIFCLGMIVVSFLLGFYFGYDTASDYCREVISDCVTKLKESSSIANAFLQKDYEKNLLKEYENMVNWSINLSNIIK